MSKFITTLCAAALSVTAGVAAPASAAPKAAQAPAKTTRYCFTLFQDGPMIHRNVCKTREDWRRSGVRVSDYLR